MINVMKIIYNNIKILYLLYNKNIFLNIFVTKMYMYVGYRYRLVMCVFSKVVDSENSVPCIFFYGISYHFHHQVMLPQMEHTSGHAYTKIFITYIQIW